MAFFEIDDFVSDSPISILAMTPKIHSDMTLVQNKLSNVLPSYMVPSLYVPMSSFPMSTSGKLDRKRLVQIFKAYFNPETLPVFSLAVTSSKRAPSTANEVAVQSAWSETLGLELESIGRDDSFLRSGGDSLAAMRLSSILRDAGLSLSVSNIFRHPVLYDMASIAASTDNDSPHSLTKPFALASATRSQLAIILQTDEETIEDAYPCTPLQVGLMAITLHQPFAYTAREAFRLSNDVDLPKLRHALEMVAKVYPIIRTRIVQSTADDLLQVVTREVAFVDITMPINLYLEQDRTIPMTQGEPLWRFAILQDKARHERYLVWTAHHSGYVLPSWYRRR